MPLRTPDVPDELRRALDVKARPIGNHVGALQGGMRQSAKGLIKSRAENLRREAAQLDRLADCIDDSLPADADQALYDLACRGI